MITDDPTSWPICRLCNTAIEPFFVSRLPMHRLAGGQFAHEQCVTSRQHERAQSRTDAPTLAQQAALFVVEVTL